MSTIDDAIDQKSFYDLKTFVYTENIFANEASDINEILFIIFSTIKQHNCYSNIINNLKYEQRPHFSQMGIFRNL